MKNEIIDVEFTDNSNTEPEMALAPVSDTDRAFKVWSLRTKGVPTGAIAKTFNMSLEQVNEDLVTAGAVYRKELLNLEGVDIVAQNIQWLDEMERIALYEANQLPTQVIKLVDPDSGKVTEERIVDKNRAAFFDAALKARQMKLQLLKETGIISKGNPELLFKKLGDMSGKEEEVLEERSEEEIQLSIARLMKFGRFMKKPLGSNET